MNGMIERKVLMKQVGSAAKLFAVAVVLVVAAFVASGCGSSSNSSSTATTDSNGNKQYAAAEGLGTSKKTVVDSKDSFNKEQQAVVTQITAFGDATASKDYKKLCNLLSTEAAKIGGDCVSTFQKTGSTISDFKLTIKSVTVDPNGKDAKASVSVTSNASPKPQLQDIALVKEKGEWKIQILGQ
jgi:hypothetical protein